MYNLQDLNDLLDLPIAKNITRIIGTEKRLSYFVTNVEPSLTVKCSPQTHTDIVKMMFAAPCVKPLLIGNTPYVVYTLEVIIN